MFSPQRKAVSFGKGKTAAFEALPPPPPPMGSLSETASLLESETMGDMDDWRRFKEAGLLDEASMVRKDHDALAEKVSNLETQLFDYQYNMGLLLIEKEDWTSKFEELRQALAETNEILKREQTANLIALSEAEKREENLRKALGTEKKCVVELEKALRDMNGEQAKIKHSSDSMLAEANTLLIGVEEKSLELEKKLQAAEAKLAAANGQTASLNIRLEEIEARESVLEKEHQTSRAEREVHRERFNRQQEDLRDWEQKLHGREVSLCNSRRTLDVREQKANENERILTQKEKEIQELQKKIDSLNVDQNHKKEEINKQLEDLLSKEKEADLLRISLEKKDKELKQLEEKLSAREKMEVKQLLDEHRAILDMKMREFNLELEEKRTSYEKELFCKADALEKKEAEINHRKEKLEKTEQVMHEKTERLKEKNKEADEKLKTIKEREKNIKAEERKLEAEGKQLVADKESLQSLLAEVEIIKAENIQLEQKICEERDVLKITTNERSEHVRLQLELKQEIDKFRLQKELVLDETKELKQEKENFKKQWEDLDKKRSKISAELKQLADTKENLERLRRLEEDRLKEERHLVQEVIQRELENLRVEKDLFADKMKAEQLALAEKAQLEHCQMVQDFELQSMNLETDMQNQREKLDKLFHDRQSAFEDERETELDNIKHLKEVGHKEMEEVRIERLRVERKREELALNKEKLKVDQLEIQNDIDQLSILSKKIKDQREELFRERSKFLAFVDKLKRCNDGGEAARELMLSGLRNLNQEDAVPLPSQAEEISERSSDLGSSKSGERMSWLKKCTSRILKLPPIKKSENVHTPISAESPPSMAARSKTEEKAKDPSVVDNDGTSGPSTSEGRLLTPMRKCIGAADAQKVQFEKAAEVDGRYAPAADEHSHLDNKAEEGPEDSLQSESKSSRRKPSKRRPSGLHRTRSVQAAVEEAGAFLAETQGKHKLDDNILPSKSYDISESLSDSVRVGKDKSARKRQGAQSSHISESEQDGGDSEACSGSVTTGGRRRKRQRANPSNLLTPGEERYNLRSRKNVGTVKGAAEPKKTQGKEAGGSGMVGAEANLEGPSLSSSGVAKKGSGTNQLGHVTTVKTVENKVVRFITPDQNPDGKTGAEDSIEIAELSVEVNDNVKYGGEDESGSTIHQSDDELDEDEEDVQPGEVSIGKKIWTFFTT